MAEATMAGKGQAVLIATVLGSLSMGLATAAAQPIPLPPPVPFPRTGNVPPPPSMTPAARPSAPAQSSGPAQSSAPAQNSAPKSSSPTTWLPSFFGGGDKSGSEFEPGQRALADKASQYLSNVHVMSGEFTQIGPDGRQSKGRFYVQKPGKVRFDYAPPTRIDIIADGSSVVVRDKQLATQDIYPLSQTPLRFLLSDRIDLIKDTTVTGIYADDTFVTIVVEESQLLVGKSRLMMMFGAKDFQLKQWVVTDPQGYDTTVAVSNLNSTRRPDPNMFKIDFTDYRN
jgi:outer membrane lipoprotein-sorting protein